MLIKLHLTDFKFLVRENLWWYSLKQIVQSTRGKYRACCPLWCKKLYVREVEIIWNYEAEESLQNGWRQG